MHGATVKKKQYLFFCPQDKYLNKSCYCKGYLQNFVPSLAIGEVFINAVKM